MSGTQKWAAAPTTWAGRCPKPDYLQAYNDIKGRWIMQNNAFVLCIDHVQSDPYASPSRIRVEVGPCQYHVGLPRRIFKDKDVAGGVDDASGHTILTAVTASCKPACFRIPLVTRYKLRDNKYQEGC